MRRRILIAVLAALPVGTPRAGRVEKERAEPPPPPAPVTIDGVRYEAPHWVRTLGLPHNGGWVIAYDATSGARLWAVQVYGLAGPAAMEADKREVFIVELRAGADGRQLSVLDERGRRWRLDLRTRSATPVRAASGPG